MEIPDIKSLYPIKKERAKRLQYITNLKTIYVSLIYKMIKKPFIELIRSPQEEEEVS
jgi:hypothetical protein